MGSIGFTEILLIFLVVLLLFGAKKLPEVARGMGQALKEFRKAAREVDVEDVAGMNADESPPISSGAQGSQEGREMEGEEKVS